MNDVIPIKRRPHQKQCHRCKFNSLSSDACLSCITYENLPPMYAKGKAKILYLQFKDAMDVEFENYIDKQLAPEMPPANDFRDSFTEAQRAFAESLLAISSESQYDDLVLSALHLADISSIAYSLLPVDYEAFQKMKVN